jgi:7-carboxy-7-deazaguanine synthase
VHPEALALRVAEGFWSLQGEGPTLGTPAHFLRLQGCPVGCVWCDTRYTWEPGRGTPTTAAAAFAALTALGPARLLVITGGEPLVHPGIDDLLVAALARWPEVEVETSGLAPAPRTDARLACNWSPKLPSATPRWRETWAHAAAFLADPRTRVKLVVGDEPDPADALRLLAEHAVPRERVWIMPEGLTDAALHARGPALAEWCKREGLRFSPRLHVWLWGARRGV